MASPHTEIEEIDMSMVINDSQIMSLVNQLSRDAHDLFPKDLRDGRVSEQRVKHASMHHSNNATQNILVLKGNVKSQSVQ